MKHQEHGFTLVELAIVMTIIGLLIGGILKGQELMENARVTATIAQVRSYEAAVTTFRDTYAAIPGDMKNADTRIPGCGPNCGLGGAVTSGDSIVGLAGAVGDAQADFMNNTEKETILFWTEMGLADLIAGVTDEIVQDPMAAMAWGETHPAAKIGGGFHIKHADGNPASSSDPNLFPDDGTMMGVTLAPSGLHLELRNSPDQDLDATLTGQFPISPNRAAQIDRKMDDGEPTRGFVRGIGATGCFANAGGGDPDVYNEQSTQKDCSLLFRVQG